MASFGKRLRACREDKKLSQQALAKELGTSYTVIGKYERDEMTPSIDVAKNLAKILDTTVGYLLGETEQANLFRDPKMLERFQDIISLPDKQKESLLLNIDHFIKASKISLL